MMKTSDEFYDDGEELIDAIRAVRHAISARFEHDPEKIVAYYMEMERTDPSPYIPAPDTDAGGRSAA